MINWFRTYKKYTLAISVITLFIACSKADYDTNISIESLQVLVEGADTVQNSNVIAYLFIADTTTHQFTSYQEAAEGKITLIKDGSRQNAILEATIDGLAYLNFPTTKEKNLVVAVCDTKTLVYYYRNVKLEINLPSWTPILIMRQYIFKDDPLAIEKENNWVGKK